MKLTKQEHILVALLRGLHLEPKELETAKEQIRILELNLKARVK